MAAAPPAIPFRMNQEDRGAIALTESIDSSIKSAPRTIARVSLKDTISFGIVLKKAGLKSLNEMVATIYCMEVQNANGPTCEAPFSSPNSEKTITTQSDNDKARLPVPGYCNLAANLLARAWNEETNLRNSTSFSFAKLAASNWARSLQI